MVNGMKAKLQDKVEKVEKSEEATQLIRKFEQIIRSKNENIIWLPCWYTR